MKPSLPALPLVFTFVGFACVPNGTHSMPPGIPHDSAATDPLSGTNDINAEERSTEPGDTPAQGAATFATPAPTPAMVQRQLPRLHPVGQYRVRMVDGSMHDLRVFRHDGRAYVLGAIGERYALVISNPTPRRVEAVISIDGLDAIDGTSADYVHNRGYILPAFGTATIEGFRTSMDQVAAFRFSSVADSYAGRLGQSRDVGVIGIAFFPEEEARPAPEGAGTPPVTAAPSARAEGVEKGAAASNSDRAAPERRGLGTEFGETRASHVDETAFTRATLRSPTQLVSFRYDDRAGLIALGIHVDPPAVSDDDVRLRETADPFRSNRFASPPP